MKEPNYYSHNSRVQAYLEQRKSLGVSCNTYALEDTIDSIASGHAWSYQVMAYQGAPSIDFSNLRPANYELSTGGTSSGAVSFMYPLDAIVSTMRRSEKKNGAGIAYLSWDHPELDSFLAADFKQMYKAVYVPAVDTTEAEMFLANPELVQKLANAYDDFNCFLVKRPLPVRGEPLYTNLCTEVEIPHKGSCILGAHNLAAYDWDTLYDLPLHFTASALRLNDIKNLVLHDLKNSPLACESPLNNQIGLTLFGLSSLLGRLNVTYSSFRDALGYLVSGTENFMELERRYLSLPSNVEDNYELAYLIALAYHSASVALRLNDPDLRAAFCIQPTVSTAQRSFDLEGYQVSPEIQPVVGLKTGDGVKTIIKSAVKGDAYITYHPKTWTIDEVSYNTYAETSGFWQQLMNMTGLAHRHSHCFYGERFTANDIYRWYRVNPYKDIRSYYYRLSNKSNVVSLKKDVLWQDVSENELFDDNELESFITKHRIKQEKGAIECACEN